jgi:hypothetical protein
MRIKLPISLLIAISASQHAYVFGPGYSRINAAAESAETAYTNPAEQPGRQRSGADSVLLPHSAA